MVNENHFRFDRNSFFNFWKTIYDFQNRKSFFEIKLFIFPRTFDIRFSESGNDQSSKSNRQNLATEILPMLESDDIRPSSPDSAKMTDIRLDLNGYGH
jgi:hypothetical protein